MNLARQHACQCFTQRLRRGGLGEIADRAKRQRFQHRGALLMGRENRYWQPVCLGPQTSQAVQAMTVGKVKIQQYQIESVGVRFDHCQRFTKAGGFQ